MSSQRTPASAEKAQTEAGNDGRRLEARFAPFAAKMEREGLPDSLIHHFRHYYGQLVKGGTGFIASDVARPVDSLPGQADLEPYREAGREALARLAVIKLNGGLGTSMGMEGPKSLIEVKEGLRFIDIIAHQLLSMRRVSGARLPLILMNSFNTRQATLDALAAYPAIGSDVPLDFLQHKIPKVWQEDLAPATWPDDPEKEWCPPGHGDIYLALLTSGILDKLLAAGYEYAFVSNSDNLGAVVSTEILGFFAEGELPFLMEVTRRTPADRKGGHLARDPEGGLLLREIAQCPPDELDQFQDTERYRFFNTNNLWVHLPSLKETLDARDGLLDLPMIRNEKPVDPTQPDSPRVYQIETAMGLAIGAFPNAQALEVSRRRFLPVKRTNDLLVLWSDAYVLDDDYHVVLDPRRDGAGYPAGEPLVELDDDYYKLFDQLQERFPHGAPSLLAARSLKVEGNIYFERDVVVRGDVTLAHAGPEPRHIEAGSELEG